MKKKLMLVVNNPDFFLSHRLPIALAAKDEGYEVHVATTNGTAVSKIIANGLVHHELPLSRNGRNPLNELRTFWFLCRLFREVRPILVHLVTIKPVIYGGIAARISNVPCVVSAISGLGFVFLAKGLKAAVVRFIVKVFYRLSFGKARLRVIFQNPDDKNSFIDQGILERHKAVLIRGSGVNLADYPISAEPKGRPVVIMASRLLRDKGVNEYVQAARLIKQQGIDVRFLLIGDIDPQNPATLMDDDLEKIRSTGDIELLGFSKEIPALFEASNIVVLPSYREGLPKVLVEAAAAGRAVVTTDVPGCRDAIEVGVSGLLVPARDIEALAKEIQKLIDDPILRNKMATEGRRLAEREFSIDKISQAHIEIYRALEASL